MTPGGICTDCDNCSWSHCRGRVLNVGRKNRRHTNSDKTGYTTLSCTDRKSHNPLLALVRFFALLRSQTRCPPEVGEDGEPMQAPPDSYSSATSHDICEKNSAKIPGAFHLFFFLTNPPNTIWRQPSLSDTRVDKMEHFLSWLSHSSSGIGLKLITGWESFIQDYVLLAVLLRQAPTWWKVDYSY